jgi:hypothetical protein
VGLLEADDCRVATVGEGLQASKLSSEAIHIPLKEDSDDNWRGAERTRKRSNATAP